MIAEKGFLGRKEHTVSSGTKGSKPPSVNSSFPKQASDEALKHAVRHRRGVKAVQEELDAGANPNARDYTDAHKVGRGWDADYYPSSTTYVLAMAVRSKDVEVVRALLKAGADPSLGEQTGSSSFQVDGGERADRDGYIQSPMDIALRMDLKDIVNELQRDKAEALSASTNLPDDMVEKIMEKQLVPSAVPETRVYNQFCRG